MKKILLLLTLFSLFIPNLFAQEKDSLKYDDEFFDNFYVDDFDVDVEFKGMPSLELTSGLSLFSNRGTDIKYNDRANIGLKLGTVDIEKYKKDYLVSYKDDYLHMSYFSKDLYNKDEISKISTSIWQFGFGFDKGYGYKLGSISIIPYTGWQGNWTRITSDSLQNQIPEDRDNLELYDKTFRFGHSTSSGVLIHAVNTIAVDLSYKRSVVLPRTMFWYQAGSLLLDGIGNGLIDSFVKKVFKNSPAGAPIVNLILKTAFNYGMYELRKDRMAWPFDTAKPLTFDSFNVGLKFTL